ncbi:tetratricopeptide repeat-containing diguanylate cyclase [Shewanella sp. OMA3-2]|uniref:tetratricopeptide repeat-containing diguanylate cyclase n=1 Tax=Shewanella sp. OMA3-2 TaxID=2908650 RepID=UPI001F46829B|nr:GGDEF domain-containing protein [Shewanella sp. OMA3-2]UJF21653.1 GGDEF domain-containing protein [Shewanella sp. OMA3-2]
MQLKLLTRIFTLSIVMLLPLQALSNEHISIQALEELAPLPPEFETYGDKERVSWLTDAISNATDDVNIYRLTRKLAFQYERNNANDAVVSTCQSFSPEKHDLDYRLLCLLALKQNDQAKLRQLLELQQDALDNNNISIAAESLSIIGWIQSGVGDIEQAFLSYEAALPLAEHVNIYLLNDITLNLATLYIVHGDNEYIDKGVDLMLESITRLKDLKTKNPASLEYVDSTLARIYFNLGIANIFHRTNYEQALPWFELINPKIAELRQSVLVFSSLSYIELDNTLKAKELLQQSYTTPASHDFDSEYLTCYQQVIQIKLAMSYDIDNCTRLSETTPIEVQQDLFKRMIESDYADLSELGLTKLYALYQNSLQPLLKQNSAKSASRTELSRLQQESRLKGELIEKERALTAAVQDKIASQSKLSMAIITVFVLVLLIVLLQLRQKQKLANQFARMSLFDSLTGLHNRHYFEQNIDREINFVKRAKEGNKYNPIAIYLFDIDHFKKVNDNYGHDIGDNVLKEFSRRINESIRDSDMFIRWGGEEFILVARLFDTADYHRIAERVRNTISQVEFELENNLKLKVSCTVGGVIYPNSPKETLDIPWAQLVKLADNALYMGKRQQRNCWVCIDEILAPKSFDLVLHQDLEESISKKLLSISHSM